MKQLLEIAKCRCKEVLFTYDDEKIIPIIR